MEKAVHICVVENLVGQVLADKDEVHVQVQVQVQVRAHVVQLREQKDVHVVRHRVG